MIKVIFPIALILPLVAGCGTQTRPTDRIKDVAIGQTATVRVRSATVAEIPEPPGIHAFTVRDAYDTYAIVKYAGDYPIWGATCDVTGKFSRDGKNTIIDAKSIRDPYGTPWVPIISSILLFVVIGGVVTWFVTRPPKEWGYLDVVSGAETAKEFVLRGSPIQIGREPDSKNAIQCFFDDQSVSRKQGVLTCRGSRIVFENLSINGTVVDDDPVGPNQKVTIHPGSAIEFGNKNAVLRFRPKGLKRADPNLAETVFDPTETMFDPNKKNHEASVFEAEANAFKAEPNVFEANVFEATVAPPTRRDADEEEF